MHHMMSWFAVVCCRYACQIFEHAKQQLPGLEKQIAAGEFQPLKVRQAMLHTHFGLPQPASVAKYCPWRVLCGQYNS
jgi:hypothetical protein